MNTVPLLYVVTRELGPRRLRSLAAQLEKDSASLAAQDPRAAEIHNPERDAQAVWLRQRAAELK